ncbi:hypothetical protein GCM10010458_05280 [Microbacterium luteolum]|uniref:TnsA-like heteromeric transposase endonuclease subunit n=1 Tax=Microbacterium luteolum TaxID=69367 RepID=A0ABY7XU05_MICLT|nr:hypothetical protein [Microbacterium luteolum]WDM43328.1 hypothetical protein KV395_08720 [Microbacterium luteolum]
MGTVDVHNLLDEPRALCRLNDARKPANLSIDEFASILPESLQPVARIPTWRGKQSYEGRWWFSTIPAHVAYASGRECDLLVWLDFAGSVTQLVRDPAVIVSARTAHTPPLRPWLYVQVEDGSRRLFLHAKDVDRAPDLADVLSGTGIGVEVSSRPDDKELRFIKWLSGYRFTRFRLPQEAECQIRAACATPRALGVAIHQIAQDSPYDLSTIRGNLYSQIWRHEVDFVDGYSDLSDTARICAA